MESESSNNQLRSVSHDSEDLHATGTSGIGKPVIKFSTNNEKAGKIAPSTLKGVENAKKRLRAFSIQKKSAFSPIRVPKPVNTGNATILIGKLASAKPFHTATKVEDADKKPLKPPKPGAKQVNQESYTNMRKKTLAEIEDMKRKMELVELGIPLGLICPTPNSDQAMPTKAMPPIKSFLAPDKVDEIIREAKKARAEGKEFKFDYQKLLPDYDNPFQRKKDETGESKADEQSKTKETDKSSYKYESNRHSSRKSGDRGRYRDNDKYKGKDRSHDKDVKSRERDTKHKDKNETTQEKDAKSKDRSIKSKTHEDNFKADTKLTDDKEDKNFIEQEKADLNLKDFVVCDSWSDNEEKQKDSTPKATEKVLVKESPVFKTAEPMAQIKESRRRKEVVESFTSKHKVGKLQPVVDSFEYEIDPNEDEILDIFDENSSTDKYTKVGSKIVPYASPMSLKLCDFDGTLDGDDTFLESVINEIKQEDIDEASQDKGLVEYDESPCKDDSLRDSITPDLDDSSKGTYSSRSDYSDGYKSVESGYKSTDTRLNENELSDRENAFSGGIEMKMTKCVADSLETWSFVLKICQPLLFRHDKNKCYKETRVNPKLWYTENPKICNCVKDRKVVYQELETCKSTLVDNLYTCKQLAEAAYPTARGWYPRESQCLVESSTVQLSSEWEADDSQTDLIAATPEKVEDISLDQEYQKFMDAVWPEVNEAKSETPRSSPVRKQIVKKKATDDNDDDKSKAKRIKLSSEGWSQESDVEPEVEKSKKQKEKRKRKHSSTTATDSSESDVKKRRKMKKKGNRKSKSKEKQTQLAKKNRLKDKKKKKQIIRLDEDSDIAELEKVKKRRDKKARKKKLQKMKKKNQKKKKSRARSSSSSSSTDSSSDSELEKEKRKRKRKNAEKKKKKRKQSYTDESQPEELFDVNILKNIKSERLSDEEKEKTYDFSPRRQKTRENTMKEIINVKELQNDFVGNSIKIKKEIEELRQEEEVIEKNFPAVETKIEETSKEPENENTAEEVKLPEEKVPEDSITPTPEFRPTEESNQSQCSSQESSYSAKDQPVYEKDNSHLRPSSQNSNYNFQDVMSNEITTKDIDEVDQPDVGEKFANPEDTAHPDMEVSLEHDVEESHDSYEHGNYEMYEQMAMAYQSDVASQKASPPDRESQRIETVVGARGRGEIKCDWRAGDSTAAPPDRPSRWGLKPGDVNIVLTGGTTDEQFPIENVVEPVYKIQSIANRTDNSNSGYDEAYLDMYGASDKLQYGDCFSTAPPPLPPSADKETAPVDSRRANLPKHASSLDDRIDLVMRTTVLGDVAKVTENEKDGPEKGILVTKLTVNEGKNVKRVSFADGYKPGQDSDVEEPPVKKRKKGRRFGCAWPCPLGHPDHVPLWDALPPPAPPPGSPPPPAPAAPPPALHLLRQFRPASVLSPAPHPMHKFDPNVLPTFVPPEPPPGLITF